LTSISSDRELDQYLSGDEFSSYQLVNLLYPEIKRSASDAELRAFDVVPVNKESVKSYIVWLSTEADLLTPQKKNQALRTIPKLFWQSPVCSTAIICSAKSQ
jgi:hypothetical protein